MPQKIRFITLAGLLFVLAAGAFAALPRSGDDNHSPCTRGSSCQGTLATPCDPTGVCGVQLGDCQEKPKEKCCCQPGKPCDNCPCKEKNEVENNDADRCGDEASWQSGGECQDPVPGCVREAYSGNNIAPSLMAGLPYPIPGMHTPIPYSVPPPPFMPQMSMPGMMPPPGMMPQMVQMSQMPQMSQMMPQVMAEGSEDRQYLVEMKLTEKDKTVATPKLMVTEGKPAQMSTGTTHASLWTAGVPSNDFGHEGYQIDIIIKSDRKNHACLDCWLWTSTPVGTTGITALNEGRCHTTQIVELGKPAKLMCGQHVLEVTIKEQSSEVVSGSTEPCEKPCCDPCIEGTCPASDEFQGCKMAVRPAHFVAPKPKEVKKPAKMTFTTVEGHPCCEGKACDLNPPARLLKVCCDGATLTCEKFEVEMPGCGSLKVCCDGDRVMVVGDTLKAMADCVCTGGEEDGLAFEGHVRVVSHKGKVDVDSGKVHIKLDMCDFVCH